MSSKHRVHVALMFGALGLLAPGLMSTACGGGTAPDDMGGADGESGGSTSGGGTPSDGSGATPGTTGGSGGDGGGNTSGGAPATGGNEPGSGGEGGSLGGAAGGPSVVAACVGHTDGDVVCADDGVTLVECESDLTETSEVGECPLGEACFGGECFQASCAGLAEDCGPGEDENCCASPLVTGGTFDRGGSDQYPATVSDFRLDRFEVTVGRLRRFRAAWERGWRPPTGSGTHEHLRGGDGLVTEASLDEPGWDSDWDDLVGVTTYAIAGGDGTWSEEPGDRENYAMNYVNWYDAYAFCIWDGGFLPSDAEWEYAAAGGDQERTYAWGEADPTCDLANYEIAGPVGCEPGNRTTVVGSRSPQGDGRWGQADLTGNVEEFMLDGIGVTAYPEPCEDCVTTPAGDYRVDRGGSAFHTPDYLPVALRYGGNPEEGYVHLGFRCARSP